MYVYFIYYMNLPSWTVKQSFKNLVFPTEKLLDKNDCML